MVITNFATGKPGTNIGGSSAAANNFNTHLQVAPKIVNYRKDSKYQQRGLDESPLEPSEKVIVRETNHTSL